MKQKNRKNQQYSTMDRRKFLKSSVAAAGALALTGSHSLLNAKERRTEGNVPRNRVGCDDRLVGTEWSGWKKGHLQVHFIYTGVCESAFYIFPDGTTMLLDCGDHNAIGRGELAVPVLPHSGRHAGEWIARYVTRVNPNGVDVDYAMLSHYHNDHAGCKEFYAAREVRDGKEHVLSGFTQAAETLRFHKAIDRSWPDFADPLPMRDDFDAGAVGLIKQFYDYESLHHGMVVERFRLGATDQIVPVHDVRACKDFTVRNISANGRICAEDGTITDLYADRIREEHLSKVNENGMSLGIVIAYGPFRFYSAGDFSDSWKKADGTTFRIEDAMATVCGRADVAKVNHHGHYSMTPQLLQALRSQVYISCVWDQLHNVDPVMTTLTDRTLYPGDRMVCPGILPSQRRAEDEGKAWMDDVSIASYEGSHIVLDVEPGGKRFTITHLSAADESMLIKCVRHYTSGA